MSVSRATADPTAAVHPLFASNPRLWVRIWVATQMGALVLGAHAAAWADSIRQQLHLPGAGPLLLVLVLLVIYHVAGMYAYHWLLRRRWALLLFVPAGWSLILFAIERNHNFGLLLVGGVIQGFVFLPFAWAMALLGVLTATMAAVVGVVARAPQADVRLVRAAAVVATGIMIGTVLLYIHRANRDAMVRTRLLRQLEEAQRDLAERARDAGVRDERQRFARDIHDTLAQGFISVIRHLEAIELSLGATAPATEDSRTRVLQHLSHAKGVSQESLAEVRRLVWALRPAALDGAPLAQALGRVVAQWRDATGIDARFTADDVPLLQPDAEVIFLRATQEALSNVARHASARHVSVSLACVDGLVLFGVEDDGCGFAQPDVLDPAGRGLLGMRQRVQKWQGHLMIDSTVGEGTSITVALPLSAIAAPGDEAPRLA